MMYVLVGLSTLTSILLVVLLGTVASLSSTVDSTVASLSTAAEMAEQSSILRDGLAATFDEGRMRSMLTAGALFAQKVGDINWELDPDRDDDLCYMRQLYDGTTYRSCPVEIDSRDQNDIEDVCEKAGDIMTDLASGLSTEVQVELDHIPNLHDMLKGLFQADWATFATSCEQVATQVKEADWEDIGVSSRDAGEIQAYAHAVAKTCEKIERRWN